MTIADAAQYEVRSCQSGILFYFSGSFTDCQAKAIPLAAEYPDQQLCVIPQGSSVLSNRPLIPFPYPAAGQPVLSQES